MLPQKPRLLDQVREKIRLKHHSIRTEKAYVDWIKRFIFFHQKRHPKDMGTHEVEQYLSHLAIEGQVSASTQNQALCALLFLYREVLKIESPSLNQLTRVKVSPRLPVVLTQSEVKKILDRLSGLHQLAARRKFQKPLLLIR